MRKLYVVIAAFAALMFSQIGYAIPIIPGATDIATEDSETYYALMARDDGWFVEGYDASGAANGFKVQLTPSAVLTPETQTFVGLAFNGSSFYVLRDDLQTVYSQEDSWSVVGFNMDGSYDGSRTLLGPSPHVAPSRQTYVGLSMADEGFFGLRNDSLSAGIGTDTWTRVDFNLSGGYAGTFETMLQAPSIVPFSAIASFNMSPVQHEVSTNLSVPEPGTGLLLGSMFALGFLGRKKLKVA